MWYNWLKVTVNVKWTSINKEECPIHTGTLKSWSSVNVNLCSNLTYLYLVMFLFLKTDLFQLSELIEREFFFTYFLSKSPRPGTKVKVRDRLDMIAELKVQYCREKLFLSRELFRIIKPDIKYIYIHIYKQKWIFF